MRRRGMGSAVWAQCSAPRRRWGRIHGLPQGHQQMEEVARVLGAGRGLPSTVPSNHWCKSPKYYLFNSNQGMYHMRYRPNSPKNEPPAPATGLK